MRVLLCTSGASSKALACLTAVPLTCHLDVPLGCGEQRRSRCAAGAEEEGLPGLAGSLVRLKVSAVQHPLALSSWPLLSSVVACLFTTLVLHFLVLECSWKWDHHFF